MKPVGKALGLTPPKVEKPKTPIDPVNDSEDARGRASQTGGQSSLISAGRLKKKATTVKSSLLGG